ncbi:VOC family protein [Antrihabitans cavernicola]|uniref:VOC family protein n=1 Tax=Antrihabitans cavernicola TaxID=2495913 RepID=A0A5A7SIN4_9NOCA|nr:VOC family protein [Spelaeibacter cavernicola]KAA0024111.1 VOC family protein [Spelaeibacter cavernicola]
MPTRDQAWPQGTPCWIDVQVDDVAQAREFYSSLFGWQIDDGPDDAGGYVMALVDGRPAAGIGPKMGDDPMPSVWTTYLAADSADDIAKKVAAAGGQAFMPPFDVMDVGRMFVAADPAGAVFGVWEAKAHKGAAIYNQHGTYCWNEAHTTDYAAAKVFYSAVFGWTYTELGDTYCTFAVSSGDMAGGVADESATGASSHWLTWFQVDDTDAALAKAVELGGSVLEEPSDTPFGRSGVITGSQGEVFGVIDPSRAVPPA